MGEQADSLDRTIRNVVAFPVTVFGILFAPRRVLSAAYEARRCEPGIALAVSLTAYFVANRALITVDSGDVSIELVPEGSLIGRVVVIVALILLAQALVLSLVSKRGTVGPDWVRWAHLLAYPAALGFLVSGLTRLASLQSGEVTEALARMLAHFECLDSLAIEKYGSCSRVVDHETAGFVRQANLLSFWVTAPCYLIALSNVIRLSLRATIARKLAAVLLTLLAAGSVNFISLALMERTQMRIEALTKKETSGSGNHALPRSKE